MARIRAAEGQTALDSQNAYQNSQYTQQASRSAAQTALDRLSSNVQYQNSMSDRDIDNYNQAIGNFQQVANPLISMVQQAGGWV